MSDLARATGARSVVILAVAVSACAARASEATDRAPIALDDAIARFCDPAPRDAPPVALHPSAVGRSHADHPDARPSVRGRAEPARGALGSSATRVDVRLRDADLANALRMLADAARVPIVIDGDLAGTVTLELRRVDPLQAIALIAAAHGARADRVGPSVVVRGP